MKPERKVYQHAAVLVVFGVLAAALSVVPGANTMQKVTPQSILSILPGLRRWRWLIGFGLWLSAGSTVLAVDCDTVTKNLYAGPKDTTVRGTVTVKHVVDTTNGDYLTIEFHAVDAQLTEAQAAVVEEVSDFPLNPTGSPKIEQYPYSTTTAPFTFQVPIASVLEPETTGTVLISAHAESFANGVELGLWSEGTRFKPKGSWSTYFSYAVQDCPIDKFVFVTSQTYNGNLGGLDGADEKCQTLAGDAGLTGTYKAWLSDSVTDAADRITHSTAPYKLRNDTKVADDYADLADGSIDVPIDVNESGGAVGTSFVWTNTQTDGTAGGVLPPPIGHCDDWSQAFGASGGNVGSSAAVNSAWTVLAFGECELASRRLYCIEQ